MDRHIVSGVLTPLSKGQIQKFFLFHIVGEQRL